MLSIEDKMYIDGNCWIGEPILYNEFELDSPRIIDVIKIKETFFENMITLFRLNENCLSNDDLKISKSIGFFNYMFVKHRESFITSCLNIFKIIFRTNIENVKYGFYEDSTLYITINQEDKTLTIDKDNYDYIREVIIYMCCRDNLTKKDFENKKEETPDLSNIKSASKRRMIMRVFKNKQKSKEEELRLARLSTSWTTMYVNLVNWDSAINYEEKKNMTLKQIYTSYRYLALKEDSDYVRMISTNPFMDDKSRKKLDLSFPNEKFNKQILIPMYSDEKQ